MVPRKDVPFGIKKLKLNIHAPFSQKSPFWGPILTVLRNFHPKTALSLAILRKDVPFGIKKSKLNIHAPFSTKIGILGPDFDCT